MCDVSSLIEKLKKFKACIDETYINEAIANSSKITTIIIAQDPYPTDPLDIPIFLKNIEEVLKKPVGRFIFKEILHDTFVETIFPDNFTNINNGVCDEYKQILNKKVLYEAGFDGFLAKLCPEEGAEEFAYYLLQNYGILFLNSKYRIEKKVCIDSRKINLKIIESLVKSSKGKRSIYCVGENARKELVQILKNVNSMDAMPSEQQIKFINTSSNINKPKVTLSFKRKVLQINVYCTEYPKT